MADRNENTWDERESADGTEDPQPRPNFFKRLWMVLARPGNCSRRSPPIPPGSRWRLSWPSS